MREEPNGAERWVLTHDVATAHTAQAAVTFLKKRCAQTHPWAPNGEHLKPLDIFWGSSE